MSTTQSIAQTVRLYDALHDCVFNDTPLDILYTNESGITKSRTIHPLDITVGTHGGDLVHAHDSLRDRIVTFRIDRVVCWGAAVGQRV